MTDKTQQAVEAHIESLRELLTYASDPELSGAVDAAIAALQQAGESAVIMRELGEAMDRIPLSERRPAAPVEQQAEGREAVGKVAHTFRMMDGTFVVAFNCRERLEDGTPLYTHPQSPASSEAGQGVSDGKEQEAFESWAKGEGYDMSCHPLHWLFLNERTYAARQGWKAGLTYALASKQPTNTERSIVFDNDLYYFLTNIANGIDTVCQSAEASNWLVRIDKARAAMKATGGG